MIATHLRFALRRIRRQRRYTLINVTGLAVGLACCVTIVLYVVNELTYDSFHPAAGRIFRIATHQINSVGEFRAATTPGPLAPALAAGYPEVERAARIVPPPENADHVLVARGERRFFEKRVWFVDGGIFDIFRIPVVQGDPRSALARPYTVFITEGTAKKYFGGEPAFGRTLQIEVDYDTGTTKLQDFEVAGIIRNAPSNTHFKYDLLLSMPTLAANVPSLDEDRIDYHAKYTYVKLAASADPAAFEKRIQREAEVGRRKYEERFNRRLALGEYFLQPVTRIHMSSRLLQEVDPPGNWDYVYIYSVIAFLILLIGVLNFVNLSAALSVVRKREIGLRKVVGAQRRQIAGQILGESFLITLVAFVAGIGLSSLLLLPFNQMAGTDLTMAGLGRPEAVLSLIGLLVLVSLGSAFYPALILNSFRPAAIVQGRGTAAPRGSFAQRALVVGQFAISVLLVISTLTVFRQLRFMKGQALGFDLDQKIVLRVQSHLGHFRRDREAVKRDFRAHPSVRGVTVSSRIPGERSGAGYYLSTRPENFQGAPRLKVIAVDEDFIGQYGIRMAAGRPFGSADGPDRREAFIVNKAGAKALGFAAPQDALDKSFQAHYNRLTKRIVGVTEDFHYLGMKDAVEPLILDIEPSLLSVITLSVRVDRMDDLLRFLRRTWEVHFPGVPFEYAFLDESFGQAYRYEEQMGRLLGIMAALGIGVACLGLFGLSSFIARRREKEIGIRKVLGASSLRIISLLSLQYVRPVAVAVAIAAPVAWYAMGRWLREFAYRIELDIMITLISAAAALGIALATVGLQSLRASASRPADILRNE
ncbi:MAG TPA: ABC transporter permease [Candidatus Aminicenantes bacterium]|nr:ABC transporter permease [Candidatus Aminicenantes bacterium]HRY65163.1 ABC transporter permease [Candidatus Aminicenantes bacterium]HRZ72369.1 ABC transporter permease [Candidatus Aminicenantes bacterium]